MTSTTESKDYKINPNGLRKVAIHDDVLCCNCYEYGFPCQETDPEIGIMSYAEYVKTSDTTLLISDLGKIPESYQEYCELNELYSDMPDLEDSETGVIMNCKFNET